MKPIFVAAALIAITPVANAGAKLDDAVRDYGINELIIPTLNVAYSSMTPERRMAMAECQFSTLERMLDTPEEVRTAMGELPLYIEWNEGLIQDKPDIQYDHAALNAYMQCQ